MPEWPLDLFLVSLLERISTPATLTISRRAPHSHDWTTSLPTSPHLHPPPHLSPPPRNRPGISLSHPETRGADEKQRRCGLCSYAARGRRKQMARRRLLSISEDPCQALSSTSHVLRTDVGAPPAKVCRAEDEEHRPLLSRKGFKRVGAKDWNLPLLGCAYAAFMIVPVRSPSFTPLLLL